MARQKHDDKSEAGIDTDGNIYVASDAGKQINMATVGYCIEARFANDRQTVGCSVARGARNQKRPCSRYGWRFISGMVRKK
jgi:hypothetical protein